MAPTPGVSGAAVARITALIDPVVVAAGFDLEEVDVSLARGNRRSEVRILVDRNGGIDLDDVAAISRLISGALDGDAAGAAADIDRIFGEGSYLLEVSSPGVDRPLTQPRHWRRNVGRLVLVSASGSELTGRILAADPDDTSDPAAGVRIEVTGLKGRPSKTVPVAYAELGPGRVQVEFTRKPAAGEVDIDEFDDEEEEAQ